MVDQNAQQEVDHVNDRLSKSGFRIGIVPIGEFQHLEKNARYMTNEQFRNLVENIKRDGQLSSVPFCVKVDGKYRVLSGNHRVMAAKEAGVAEVLALYTEAKLSSDEQLAIQLSHNSIVGQDDTTVLAELFTQIQSIDLRYYSGLDDGLLGQLEKAPMSPLSEIPIDFRMVTFAFLPEEVDRLEDVFRQVMAKATTKDIYLNRFATYDKMLDTLQAVEEKCNIKNTATAMMVLLDIAGRHLDELDDVLEEQSQDV